MPTFSHTLLLLAYLAFGVVPIASAGERLRTARAVREQAYGISNNACDFELTGIVTFTRQEDDHILFAVRDATGDVDLNFYGQAPVQPRPGMELEMAGYVRNVAPMRHEIVATRLSRVGVREPPSVKDADGLGLLGGKFDCRLVRITGTVRDTSISELNANWAFLVVSCQGQKVYVSVPAGGKSADRLAGIVDAEISAVGVCLPYDCSHRMHMGRVFKVSSVQSIRLLGKGPAHGKVTPAIESIGNVGPGEIALLGRHRAVGRVIAAWHPGQALLRTEGGQLSHLEFAVDNLPTYGDLIEAHGLPETDLFQINLTRATWRRLPGDRMPDTTPQFVFARKLTTATNGLPRIDRYFQGRAIRIRGTIARLPVEGSTDRRLYLTSDSLIVPVETRMISESLHGVPIGSLVEIAGTCVMNAEAWRPNLIFTKTRGFFLVPRMPDDFHVIATPSWWTSGRLLGLIGALVALLLAILVWNVLLRRLSERKGRELARATLAQSESALRVQERTRLATELHDSIVQNLTGAALHLRTADKLAASDTQSMREQLSIALRTLDSCREEIRNCIWDLRNRALDEPCIENAIRRTLAPHLNGLDMSVRFHVPRNRLTDNTTHAILCIIRELVLNAIRHGCATHIQIAGCLDGGKLLFSVRDNGTGFNVDEAPGIAQGHFGLQGIRERIGLLQGDVVMTSRFGIGTKVSVSVPMPMEGKQ